MASRPDDNDLLDICYKSYGNYHCYPLTIGAKLWLQNIMKEFNFDDQFMELAAFYAYAHSRDMNAFKFDSIKSMKKIISEFALNINITEDEMSRIILDITSNELVGKKSHNDDKEISLYPALSLLINTYGKDKNYWLWEESCDTCEKMIKEAIKIKMEKAHVKGQIDNDDRSILAFSNLKKIVNDIRNSRKTTELPIVETNPVTNNDLEVKNG
jgi:hypothetical protein